MFYQNTHLATVSAHEILRKLKVYVYIRARPWIARPIPLSAETKEKKTIKTIYLSRGPVRVSRMTSRRG